MQLLIFSWVFYCLLFQPPKLSDTFTLGTKLAKYLESVIREDSELVLGPHKLVNTHICKNSMKCKTNLAITQSYISQVLQTIEGSCSSQQFGQIRNGLVSLAHKVKPKNIPHC